MMELETQMTESVSLAYPEEMQRQNVVVSLVGLSPDVTGLVFLTPLQHTTGTVDSLKKKFILHRFLGRLGRTRKWKPEARMTGLRRGK